MLLKSAVVAPALGKRVLLVFLQAGVFARLVQQLHPRLVIAPFPPEMQRPSPRQARMVNAGHMLSAFLTC